MVFLLLIIASGIAYGAIGVAKRTASEKIEKLKLTNEVSRQQQQAFNELQNVKKDLENKWNLLNGLRSTPPPEDLLYAIDNALIDIDVWFTNLRFDRIERVLQKEELVDTGYFIIVNSQQEDASLSIGTKMVISGGAQNHSALSIFVKKLLAQSIILDAKVLETSTANKNKSKHIDYVIEIIVNSREQV
jgi:hypothetical protein